MEPVFKTETIHDLTLHREFVSEVEHANRLLSFVYGACGLTLLYFIPRATGSFLTYYYLFFAAFLIVRLFLRNSKNGDTQYKRMLQLNSGQPHHLVIALNHDHILCADYHSSNQFRYTYDQFSSILDTENLLILMMEHRSCVILEKRWLKGGTVNDLTAFLFEKCTNIKRKKLRTPTIGKWIFGFFYAVIFAGALWSLANLPMFSLWDRITGKLHNGMTYYEMADALQEHTGIVISADSIDALEQIDAEYREEFGREYYIDNRESSKVMDLLCWEGWGNFEPDTREWMPSSSGIFWYDTEAIHEDAIYTDFLSGLNAMNPGLDFQNIREDYTQADPEEGEGTVTVSFSYLNRKYTIEAEYCYDWFDTNFLFEIGKILASDGQEEDLYYLFDGQAFLLYYGSARQTNTLERLTGLVFLNTTHKLISY